MEKEGFLKMEPGVQRSWLRATKYKTKQNKMKTLQREQPLPGSRIGHNQGAFPTPVQGALVTYV